MNNRLSIFNNYFYAAAFLVSCCFVWGCENDQGQINALFGDVVTADTAINVESYLSQEGRVKARLKSPIMYRGTRRDTTYVEFPRTLHADFYDDSLKIESFLDSKYGKYFENYNKVYLRDSVVVISAKGDTLRCHDLWWDQNRGLFYTDTIATYKSPGNDITGGKGMEATQDFKSVTFKYPLGNVLIGDDGFAK